MADLDIRAALQPMVDHPAAARLPVSELARRVRRRRLRRRSALAGLAVTVAIAGSLVAHGSSPQVVTIDGQPPASADDPPVSSSPSTPPHQPPTTAPVTTTTAPPPPPPTSASAATEQPSPDVAGIVVTETTTSSWDRGHCVEIRVENSTTADVTWEVRYTPDGTVATLWNATATADGTTFVGEPWNARLAAGEWTTFGVCVDT